MTLLNFGKIAALSAVTFSLITPAPAQNQAQTYQQQQQAYYEGWQEYYRQYYGVNYHQPTFQHRQGYTTQQPQRTQSWHAPQQNQPQPQQPAQQSQPAAPKPQQTQDDYSSVQANPSKKTVSPVNLDEHIETKPEAKPVDNSAWYNSYEAAWRRAHKQGRPLVLLFVHEGCPECTRMDANLSQPGAMETLACAVKARIEFTENAATVTRFGVKFTPTFLVLGPDGNEAYREVGALDVNRLRQIQPALESLVTTPPQGDTANVSGDNAKSSLSYSPAKSELPAGTSKTSQTLASL